MDRVNWRNRVPFTVEQNLEHINLALLLCPLLSLPELLPVELLQSSLFIEMRLLGDRVQFPDRIVEPFSLRVTRFRCWSWFRLRPK